MKICIFAPSAIIRSLHFTFNLRVKNDIADAVVYVSFVCCSFNH